MLEPFVGGHSQDGLHLFHIQSWMDKMPDLSAGFTSRIGGVSQLPWNSLNCALHVGDQPMDVLENRKRVSEASGFFLSDWTCGEQTHGCRVQLVGEQERGAGHAQLDHAFADTDSLITKEPGILLTAVFADCVPLFFVDPVQHAIGIAHAGWKGTALQIAVRTVEAMREAFASRSEDLLAAIGPSIGACCYEVDDHVIQQIDMPAPRPTVSGRYMLDLKEVNRQFMIRAGIKPNNIEQSSYCTSCNTDLFYSHRGENGRTGRMAGWIGIRRMR